MATVILVIHIFVALALVGIILLQRSEGGALGMGGGGGTGSFMSVRGTANLLTRTTATLAAIFMVTSLVLAILAGNHGQGASILDQLPTAPAVPSDRVTAPSIPGLAQAPAPGSAPTAAKPQVPLAK